MTRTELKEWVKKNGGRFHAAFKLGVDPSTLWRQMTGVSKVSKAVQFAIKLMEVDQWH